MAKNKNTKTESVIESITASSKDRPVFNVNNIVNVDTDIIFFKTHENAKIPEYAHYGDVGMDLYTVEDTMITKGETVIVRTGLKCKFNPGNMLTITGKSGIDLKGIDAKVHRTALVHDDDNEVSSIYLSAKKEIRIKIGRVECNYRGELGVITKNESDETIIIPAGIKIAQAILSPVRIAEPREYTQEEWDKMLEEENNSRGEGGFGSTGIK